MKKSPYFIQRKRNNVFMPAIAYIINDLVMLCWRQMEEKDVDSFRLYGGINIVCPLLVAGLY